MITNAELMDEQIKWYEGRATQIDEFFSADDQRRLADLMDRWRSLRDEGISIPQPLQDELNSLIEAELRASTSRAQAMLDSLAK